MSNMTEDQTFPLDWYKWQSQWEAWKNAHADKLTPTRQRFPGKNFLADEILGTWKINGQLVELSEMTFPNLEERDERGFLKRYDIRAIGITRGVGAETDGSVVHSFAELEKELGL